MKHPKRVIAAIAGATIALAGAGTLALIWSDKSAQTKKEDGLAEQERARIVIRCEAQLNRFAEVSADRALAMSFTEACQALNLSRASYPVNREIGTAMLAQIRADNGESAKFLAQLQPAK